MENTQSCPLIFKKSQIFPYAGLMNAAQLNKRLKNIGFFLRGPRELSVCFGLVKMI